MQERTVIVENKNGLHLRPAAKIATICRKYRSKILFSRGGLRDVDGCSITQLLLLGAIRGEEVIIKASGPDEKEAVEEIADLFTEGAGI